MKLCFTNEKAVEAWFDRVTNCDTTLADLSVRSRGSRIMAEGHTLYSYGKHFAVAMWYPEFKTFLLNTTTRRSPSTGKHQRYVRKHAPSACSIEVGSLINYDPRMSADKFLQRWDHRIRESMHKSKRAWRHKGWWIGRAEEDIRQRNSFIKTFKIPALPLPEDVTAALVTLKLAA